MHHEEPTPLMIAVRNNDRAGALGAVELGYPIEDAVVTAAESRGFDELSDLLISQGGSRTAALCAAVRADRRDRVKRLVAGNPVYDSSEVVRCAFECGNVAMADLLVRLGAAQPHYRWLDYLYMLEGRPEKPSRLESEPPGALLAQGEPVDAAARVMASDFVDGFEPVMSPRQVGSWLLSWMDGRLEERDWEAVDEGERLLESLLAEVRQRRRVAANAVAEEWCRIDRWW